MREKIKRQLHERESWVCLRLKKVVFSLEASLQVSRGNHDQLKI